MMHYQPQLAEAVHKFPARAWVEAAAVAGMTIQDVRPPEEALADPLFLKDGCVTEINDPELGAIRQVGVTYRLAAQPERDYASRGARGRAHRVRQGRGRGTGRQGQRPQPRADASSQRRLRG